MGVPFASGSDLKIGRVHPKKWPAFIARAATHSSVNDIESHASLPERFEVLVNIPIVHLIIVVSMLLAFIGFRREFAGQARPQTRTGSSFAFLSQFRQLARPKFKILNWDIQLSLAW